MQKLILLLSLLSFSVWAQTTPPEAEWKGKLRAMISSVAGTEWSDKLLGKLPEPVKGMEIPAIPKNFKLSTDVSAYSRKSKPDTEFDKLPVNERAKYNRAFIQELFYATRKIEPKDEDLSTWMNNLNQGGSREAIYQGLVLDDVYATLENLNEKPNARLLEFCVNFSKKFFLLNYTEDGLKGFNLYTLKRTITEKGLDLMEYYEGKDLDDLYTWYAVYSADLAKEYSPLLRSDLRKNESPEFHLAWAKGMPIQHIKSEFIIKTHSIMNQLQMLQ